MLKWHRLSAGYYEASENGVKYNVDRYAGFSYFVVSSVPADDDGSNESEELGLSWSVRGAKEVAQREADRV